MLLVAHHKIGHQDAPPKYSTTIGAMNTSMVVASGVGVTTAAITVIINMA